jgi:hypothetical protein
MSSGYRDWIPDSPEVIAQIKAKRAEEKMAKKNAIRGLKETPPMAVQVNPAPEPTEPVFTPDDLSRDALLEIAKKQGLEVKGNIGKDDLIGKLKEKAKSALTR